MASIDIRNFVDVNILYKKQSKVKSTRETVVLFTDDSNIFSDDWDTPDYIYSSFEEVQEVYLDMSAQTIQTIEASPNIYVAYHYAKVYFENGGIKLHVVQISSPKESYIAGGLDKEYTIPNIDDKLNSLPDEEIVIALAPVNQIATDETEENFNWSNHLEYVARMNKDYNELKTSYGVKQKIFLSVNNYEYDSAQSHKKQLEDCQTLSNLAVKFIHTVENENQEVGQEMTFAAYLSQIDVYKETDILDYCYTEEKADIIKDSENPNFSYNTMIQRAFNYNGNVDIELSGIIRNIGGNLTNGEDLVNKYVLIILHQTLSQVVFNTLTQKIKNNSGIAALYATITQELNRYLNSNYLTTDKVWTAEDLTIVKNNKEYMLITKGTALLQGYKVVILPLSSLTEEEKQQRKAPYIYVILADSYGIRKVTIDGEVI